MNDATVVVFAHVCVSLFVGGCSRKNTEHEKQKERKTLKF